MLMLMLGLGVVGWGAGVALGTVPCHMLPHGLCPAPPWTHALGGSWDWGS